MPEILGLGVDIVEIKRVQKALERYPRLLSRLFTPKEQKYCLSHSRPHPHFAARFAAKEAVSKALGTGMSGLKWTDIEVARDGSGKPFVCLTGNAALIASQRGISEVEVSLSFTQSSAVASAIALSFY